jgi:hypothetical protein
LHLLFALAFLGALTVDAQDQTQHRPTSVELSRDETPAKAITINTDGDRHNVSGAAIRLQGNGLAEV